MVSILNNVGSLEASRQLNVNGANLQRTIQRLTTGKRINRASDDAAGLGISNRLRSDIRVASQGRRNANDGVSYLQVADGVLDEASNLLIRAAELAEQSKTGTISDSNRIGIDAEFQKILNSIIDVGQNTKFNGASIFGESTVIAVGDFTPIVCTIATISNSSVSALGMNINGESVTTTSTVTIPGTRVYESIHLLSDFPDIYSSWFGTDTRLYDASYWVVTDQYLKDPTNNYLIAAKSAADNMEIAINNNDFASVSNNMMIMDQNMYNYSLDDPYNITKYAGYIVVHEQATTDPALLSATGPLNIAAENRAAATQGEITSLLGPSTTTTTTTTTTYPGISLLTANDASIAATLINSAIDSVSSIRASIGASQQQISSISNSLGIQVENLTSAYSQIQDANMSEEVVNLTKFQILNQSSTSALSQSNQSAQYILALLR